MYKLKWVLELVNQIYILYKIKICALSFFFIGSKIIFYDEGDRIGFRIPRRIPADIVFVIDEKPHPFFTRINGIDLLREFSLPFEFGLSDRDVEWEISTLGGGHVKHVITSHTDHESRIKGLGLPIVPKCNLRGDMVLRFKVKCPIPKPVVVEAPASVANDGVKNKKKAKKTSLEKLWKTMKKW